MKLLLSKHNKDVHELLTSLKSKHNYHEINSNLLIKISAICNQIEENGISFCYNRIESKNFEKNEKIINLEKVKTSILENNNKIIDLQMYLS